MPTNARLFAFTSLLAVVSCGAAAPARPSSDGSRVIVFKDGYALIVKTFTAKTDNKGEIHVDEVPDAAVLGTFWATAKEGRVVGMHAGWKDVTKTWEKTTTATEHLEILAANRGKRAEIRYTDGTIYNGTIRTILARKTTSPDPDEREVELSDLRGHSFVLRTADGDIVLATGGIRAIAIKDMRTSVARTAKTTKRTKRLTIRFEEPNAKRTVTLTYFRPGIRWIPTYRIDLESKKRARIAMQAEILNEAEDLIDTPIDIVVGVPNFRFKSTVSPLVLEATLKRALAQAAPNLMGQMHNNFSNASYSLRSSESRRADATASTDIALPGDLTGSAQQDLFVYSLPRISLKKGERVAMSVFDRRVPFRHVYTWDLHLKKSDFANSPSAAGIASPLQIAKNEVWHQIQLKNDTNTVWTTGAVMIMAGGRPLAQELLTYTSRGDEVRVPVTISVETRGSAKEKEVGRKLDALKWDGKKYARIGKLATLDLCNHKGTTIDVEISMRVGGRATNASDDGEVELGEHRRDDWTHYRGSPAVNNSSVVRWKTKLGPGETFAPTVRYHYFTRH